MDFQSIALPTELPDRMRDAKITLLRLRTAFVGPGELFGLSSNGERTQLGDVAMSFDGPPIQSPNQERRRINKPSAIIVAVLVLAFIGILIWQHFSGLPKN